MLASIVAIVLVPAIGVRPASLTKQTSEASVPRNGACQRVGCGTGWYFTRPGKTCAQMCKYLGMECVAGSELLGEPPSDYDPVDDYPSKEDRFESVYGYYYLGGWETGASLECKRYRTKRQGPPIVEFSAGTNISRPARNLEESKRCTNGPTSCSATTPKQSFQLCSCRSSSSWEPEEGNSGCPAGSKRIMTEDGKGNCRCDDDAPDNKNVCFEMGTSFCRQERTEYHPMINPWLTNRHEFSPMCRGCSCGRPQD